MRLPPLKCISPTEGRDLMSKAPSGGRRLLGQGAFGRVYSVAGRRVVKEIAIADPAHGEEVVVVSTHTHLQHPCSAGCDDGMLLPSQAGKTLCAESLPLAAHLGVWQCLSRLPPWATEKPARLLLPPAPPQEMEMVVCLGQTQPTNVVTAERAGFAVGELRTASQPDAQAAACSPCHACP